MIKVILKVKMWKAAVSVQELAMKRLVTKALKQVTVTVTAKDILSTQSSTHEVQAAVNTKALLARVIRSPRIALSPMCWLLLTPPADRIRKGLRKHPLRV